MPSLRLENAAPSDMTNRVKDVTVDTKQTDGVSDQRETTYTNQKWSQYWGYFNAIPDLKSALILKSIWNTGGLVEKGYDFRTVVSMVRLENSCYIL